MLHPEKGADHNISGSAEFLSLLSQQVLQTGAKLQAELHVILLEKTSIPNLMTFSVMTSGCQECAT